MLIKELFKKAHLNYLCNTSYPLSKENWESYKTNGFELFNNEKALSIYLHIPFCKKTCVFCEYVKFNKKDDNIDNEYVEILKQDIEDFLSKNLDFVLYGFDIGGGTPTSLSDEAFRKLMLISKILIESLPLVDDFEPSIEATFDTLNEEKIRLIKEAGFKRISIGIQTTNEKILNKNNRHNTAIKNMKSIVEMIRSYNIWKINLDFMYGLEGQSIRDLRNSLKVIKLLKPEQVTLYETRYNMVKGNKKINRSYNYRQYKYLYRKLIKMGYKARFGQNTFSINIHDIGLSSYLRYRMIDNISYKGFGISAQSKSKLGISYNIGKNGESLNECLEKKTFRPTDTYVLPKDEVIAKYIAISMYYGLFKLSVMKQILRNNPLEVYKEEFEFLKKKHYIKIDKDIVTVTKKGYKYYGAIAAMFYSNKVKEWLMNNV